jgi:hypothetical protein
MTLTDGHIAYREALLAHAYRIPPAQSPMGKRRTLAQGCRRPQLMR